MGIYLNPDNRDFQLALNSEIYIDKTMLIAYTNKKINTENRFICISRPRRFGKSMAANMLTAYYSRGCDSAEMFAPYEIAETETFSKHLNQYNVIRINMLNAYSEASSVQEMIQFLSEDIIDEICEEYPDLKRPRRMTLVNVLLKTYDQFKVPFVFIIDEWDCVFRKDQNDHASQTEYLNFLRNLLKDQSFAALTYMTGILPIKKYGEHSALNMFTEISMTDIREYAEFTGFTEAEVNSLCEQYHMSFEDAKRWYDGYDLRGVSIYNPRSVVMSMTGGYYNSYWTATETYEALKVFIDMNFDGLKEKITKMIAGESVKINTTKFQNDMTTFSSADDVLTLLIHLGYLSFDFFTSTVHIPNHEVRQEFINSIEDGGWEQLIHAIKSSEELLSATLEHDEQKVAEMIESAHNENASILKYNDGNSLACVISIAYYYAQNQYIMHREFATGKGYADIVFIPRRTTDSPAIVVELKREQSAGAAIAQIKEKNYPEKISQYTGKILLVDINYDENKGHTCIIEEVQK